MVVINVKVVGRGREKLESTNVQLKNREEREKETWIRDGWN